VNKIVNKHALLTSCSKRKSKQLLKPWITKGLLKSIRIKNKLFYSGEKEKYKQYRNKISTLTKLSKTNYYHKYFSNNLNNMKRTWQGINALIKNKRRDKRNICTLKRPNHGSVSNDPTEIPNLFNRHFATVGQNLSNQLPSSMSITSVNI
jgi:hypothetical protein